MTLEEAIKHCEEIAQDNENLAVTLWDRKEKARCEDCASEHRQLAEWLRELQDVKHIVSITGKLRKANMHDGLIDVVDDFKILFSCYKQIKELLEEVNADALGED